MFHSGEDYVSDSEEASKRKSSRNRSKSRSKSRSRGDAANEKENKNNNSNNKSTDSAAKKDRRYALYWDEADDPRNEKKELTPEEYEHRR